MSKYTLGPDIDLEKEDVRLADGTRLTPAIAEEMAESALRLQARAGRPSLTARGGRSPQVSFRVPPSLRDAAERQARREGKSISQLAREVLERYLTQRSA